MTRIIDADKLREWWLVNGQNEYIYNTNDILDSIDACPTFEGEEKCSSMEKKDK